MEWPKVLVLTGVSEIFFNQKNFEQVWDLLLSHPVNRARRLATHFIQGTISIKLITSFINFNNVPYIFTHSNDLYDFISESTIFTVHIRKRSKRLNKTL